MKATKNNNNRNTSFIIDPDDVELQEIIKKYSKRSLNPFKNKKNERLKAEEIASLMQRREEERKREEQRIREQKRIERIEVTKESISSHIRKYKLVYTVLFILLSTFATGKYAIDRYKEKVRNVAFVFSDDEEKLVGDPLDLSFTVEPATAKYDVEDLSIVFSDPELIAPNKSSGSYTCVSEGKVIAKLFYNGKEYDTKSITIQPVLISKLFLPDIVIGKGNTIVLSEPTIEPVNATNKNYTISVENENIASLKDSVLSGIELGKTVLHLSSADGYKYDVNVLVVEIEAKDIILSESTITLVQNGNHQLKVEFIPSETTIRDLEFSSSNNNIVSVDEFGKVFAKNIGEATITAKYNDTISDSTNVTVVYPPASSISLSSNYSTLYAGNQTRAFYSIEPYHNSNENVTFSSNNKSVATVDDDGLITAVGIGTAVIKATTDNGKQDTIEISVIEKPVSISNSSSESVYSDSGTDSTETRTSGYSEASSTSGTIVYIASSGIGERYHSKPQCGRMKNSDAVTLEYALSLNLTPCANCH